ncbi:hypothetical protein AB3329_08030 [Streptococcus sp. H31]|uniref:hypothetical protein n=1 Tax=Streptococcus huangxiaojuni TaxID=3237239 RepID=UPI0034A59EF3
MTKINYRVSTLYPSLDSEGKITKTNVTIISDKPYIVISADLSGDFTKASEQELIQAALDNYFKKQYVDYAMPEAIQRVDEMSTIIDTANAKLAELDQALEASRMQMAEIAETSETSQMVLLDIIEQLYAKGVIADDDIELLDSEAESSDAEN